MVEVKITLQDGTGRYVSPCGDVYTGEWRDGAFRKGKCVFENGDVYEGEWQDDVRHGKGTFTVCRKRAPGGGVYEGVWVNGALHGIAKVKYGDGGVYEGSFMSFLKHGKGTMVFANGDIYEGQWKKGRQEGLGKMIYEYGDVYEGNWVSSREHGTGTMTLKNGTTYECEWVDGKRARNGKKTYKNGDVYTGTWMDGMEDGEGKMWYKNGEIYEGKWARGKRCGHGKMWYKNGEIYEGEWDGGKRDGSGTLVSKNGTTQEGEWVADEFQGLHIRKAVEKDVDSIWNIDKEMNFEEYDKETHELLLPETVVAVEGGKVCGYMTTVMLDHRPSVKKMRRAYLDAVRGRKKDTLYVIDIAVTARSRGRGVGSELVAHALQAHGSHRFVRYTAPAIKELHIVEKIVRGRGYKRADDITTAGQYRDSRDAYSYVFARPVGRADAESDATEVHGAVEFLDSRSEAESCDSQKFLEWEAANAAAAARAEATGTKKRGRAELDGDSAKRSRGPATGASNTGACARS